MFFEQRWFSKESISDIGKVIEENKLKTINDLAEFLFLVNENGERLYTIYDIHHDNKQTTKWQKFNLIWFFFIYWIVFAPYQYVKNGRVGFSQKNKAGKFVAKIIGQQYAHGKRSDFKAGWSIEISKEKFLEILHDRGIVSIGDFLNTYSYYSEYSFENDGYIIEKENKIYRDKREPIKRFNELWLTAALFLLLPFIGTYRWFIKNEFGFDQDGKIIKFYKEKTQDKEVE